MCVYVFSELIVLFLAFAKFKVGPMGYRHVLTAGFSSPSGWRDIGVLFVENRHLEMLLL